MVKEEYVSKNIQVLDDRSHLLKRMSLTFGPETGGRSLKDKDSPQFSSQKGVAIREIFDNAMDEVRGGYGTHVKVSFYKDGAVEIQDSGRGLPVDVSDIGDGTIAHGIYKCLGVIRSGGKFGREDYKKKSSGQNGVGGSSTVQVSKRVDVTVYRDGKQYQISFKDGRTGFFVEENNPDADFTEVSLDELKVSKDTRSKKERENFETGSTVKFWLNDRVFSSPHPYDVKDLISRIELTAFLVPVSHLEVYSELALEPDPLTGEVKPFHTVFHYPEGLELLVQRERLSRSIINPLVFSTQIEYVEPNVPVENAEGEFEPKDVVREVDVNLALVYGEDYDYRNLSFVNTIYTRHGGAHRTAFEKALVKAFNERMATMKGIYSKNDSPAIFSDFSEGLTAIISVEVPEPQFTSQAKEELMGAEIQRAIEKAVYEVLSAWIKNKNNSADLQVIAEKVSTASKNRQKAREKKDVERAKNKIGSSAPPAKLLDCEMSGEEAEIMLAEGDSAATALKSARYSKFQAILPLRGKVLNLYKSTDKKSVENEEVQSVIKALGSPADDDDKSWNYGKVILMTDADIDGKHIDTLLVTMLYSLYPKTARERVYKVETPLFLVAVNDSRYNPDGRKREYYYSDFEKDQALKRIVQEHGISPEKINVSRMKGLGEVPADVLRETACNPETRRLIKLEFNDLDKIEDSLELMFGKDTDARKDWILENIEMAEEVEAFED